MWCICGLHGLSCKKGGGKHHQHVALNDVFHRALAAAGILSTLELSGLVRSDGKRPDGITYTPWAQGRPLVWDVTVPDTLAASYMLIATRNSGAVTEMAEKKKESKYSHLTHSYIFSPLAIESLGAMGPKSLALICDLGDRIWNYSGNERSSFLRQRLSVAVQRGSAFLISNTLPVLPNSPFA